MLFGRAEKREKFVTTSEKDILARTFPCFTVEIYVDGACGAVVGWERALLKLM